MAAQRPPQQPSQPQQPAADGPNAPTPSVGVCLIYTRVSGPGQEKDGESLESQETLCRALAARLDYRVGAVIREVFRGEELFGRPKLYHARADLRAKRYDALLVWHPDRLSRNPVHQAIVIEEVTRIGVRVEFVTAPLDTSPEGMFLAFAKGFGSQMEIANIRARTLGGKVRRAQTGKLPRAGHDLYGYRRDHELGVRVIYPPQGNVVRRIYDWCTVDNWGLTRIARTLDEEGVPSPGAEKFTFHDGRTPHWSQKVVRNILTHPAYKGETASFRYRTEVIIPDPERPRLAQYRTLPRAPEEAIPLPAGVTPPLVTTEQWELAQEMLRERRQRAGAGSGVTMARNANESHLLRGRVTCGTCMRPMYVEWRHRQRYAYYHCSSKLATGVACGGSLITTDELDVWVWQEVSALLRDPALLEREVQAAHAATLLQDDQDDQDGQDGRDGQDGGNGEGSSARRVLADERTQLTGEIARIERLRARTLARYNAVDNEAVLPWSVVEAELARLERDHTRATRRLEALAESARQQAVTQQRMRQTLAHLQAVYGHWQQAAHLPALPYVERVAVLEALQVRIIGNGATWRLIGRLMPAQNDENDESDAGIFVRTHEPVQPQETLAQRRAATRAARATNAAASVAQEAAQDAQEVAPPTHR